MSYVLPGDHFRRSLPTVDDTNRYGGLKLLRYGNIGAAGYKSINETPYFNVINISLHNWYFFNV